eukprot:TRINITY_DN3305_c0_g1_i2.p2 TRINITY_DN3305_c0_g1~~TRINITY_DN3305_c0_g1_i2.p2  ORF type:complete len:110 (-),score=1.90 TRINITY_DN3305_c0_g1_i2:244-573(-)
MLFIGARVMSSATCAEIGSSTAPREIQCKRNTSFVLSAAARRCGVGTELQAVTHLSSRYYAAHPHSRSCVKVLCAAIAPIHNQGGGSKCNRALSGAVHECRAHIAGATV